MMAHRYIQSLLTMSYIKSKIARAVFYSTSDSSGHVSGSSKSESGKDICDSNTSPDCCAEDFKPKERTLYESRKLGHDLPSNDVRPDFETLEDIPTGVFRCTSEEALGCGGGDVRACYQNPEYFSYHYMSYYDMHWALRRYRKPCPDTGRKD